MLLLSLCAGLFLTARAEAQYIPPGITTPRSFIPDRDKFDKSIDNSPWHLGPLRLSPYLGINDASFVRVQRGALNEDGSIVEETDFTVTVGAGITMYLPAGSRFLLTANATPEYVWWNELEEKRRLNGRYGASLFGYFNRLRVSFTGSDEEVQKFFSSEVQELSTTKTRLFGAQTEIELGRRLEFVAGINNRRISNQDRANESFSTLDRQTENASVGLRYRSPKGWILGLIHNETTVDFSEGARNLSNEGAFDTLQFFHELSKWSFGFEWSLSDLRPTGDSEFQGFDGNTSNLEATWSPTSKVDFLSYHRRSLSASLNSEVSHFTTARSGLATRLDFGKATFTIGAESGEDDYSAISLLDPRRSDDVTAVHASFDLQFRSRFSVRFGAIHTEYDSNLPDFDRDITQFQSVIELSLPTDRFKIGR